jgi:outer membrane protein, heavy metal efflux system
MLRKSWFKLCWTIPCTTVMLGCTTPDRPSFVPTAAVSALPIHQPTSATGIVQAQAITTSAAIGDVNTLVNTALNSNPRLARANALVDAAQGRMIQAGLGPNPVFSFTADELGDRTGPMGILGPQLSKEFVLGHKLTLGQAVAAREVDQAMLSTLSERYAIAGAVRAGAYELAALRRRREVLNDVIKLAKSSVEQATKAEKNPVGPLTRGDVLPLEFELERFRTDLEAVERELPALERRLAAQVGDARFSISTLSIDLDIPLPDYDLDTVRDTVMELHPEARSAAVAVERAQTAVKRAEAELIPNVTGSVGYVRQNQNHSNDWMVGVSVPLVLRNRNQGNIRAARADLVAATMDVTRIQNTLAERVANTFRMYASAKLRAEKYRTVLIPKAEETVAFVKKQLDSGVVEYLRVLQSQRAVAEARLEYNRALGEAWTAAAELSGLLMEESFPASEPIRK